jgi:hypothetical protein
LRVSHIIADDFFEAIINAGMNNWWPDKPWAVGNLSFHHCNSMREANVTGEWSFILGQKFLQDHEWGMTNILFVQILNACLALLNSIHNWAIESTIGCWHGDVVLIRNCSQAAQSTLKNISQWYNATGVFCLHENHWYAQHFRVKSGYLARTLFWEVFVAWDVFASSVFWHEDNVFTHEFVCPTKAARWEPFE